MSPKTWAPIALFVDRLLRPFGLVMWTTYYYDEDENGAPKNTRVIGVGFGRRPNLS
jgi:hypothetical protein